MQDPVTPASQRASDRCLDCGAPPGAGSNGKLKRGRCHNCYQRHIYALKKSGTFERLNAPLPVMERFLDRSKPTSNGCRLWTGTINHFTGYGTLSVNNKAEYAHRLAYTLFVGPIPDGMDVDHTCHNGDASCKGEAECLHRRCVNPDHLEPVTHRTNVTRSHLAPAGKNSRKTHCKHGHKFTPENTITSLSGRRACRACHNRCQREADARRRAARNAV